MYISIYIFETFYWLPLKALFTCSMCWSMGMLFLDPPIILTVLFQVISCLVFSLVAPSKFEVIRCPRIMYFVWPSLRNAGISHRQFRIMSGPLFIFIASRRTLSPSPRQMRNFAYSYVQSGTVGGAWSELFRFFFPYAHLYTKTLQLQS